MINLEDFSLIHQKIPLLKNLTLSSDKNLAIIGKSGAGKSLLAKCLIKLIDKHVSFNAKRFQIGDYNLLDKKLNIRNLRKDYALILQDSKGSFYPYLNVGDFFDIVLKTHLKLNKKQRKELAFHHFQKLGLKHLEFIWHSYIDQLSGGMARLVQISLALCLEPKVLICDEITASLDEKSINHILEILKTIQKQTPLIFITHDLSLAKILSQEILILEKGTILEHTDTKEFFKNPTSNYGKEILTLYKEELCF